MHFKTKTVAAAALAATTAAVALPALGGAQTGDREITAREKVRSVKFVHQKRTTKGERLATGDRVLTRQGIFNAGGKASGTLFTDCANVGKAAAVFKATLQCTSTYRFGDCQNFKPGQLPTGPRGSTGPRGATGETGPTGAPGSALAYAHVRADGTLDTARSKGVLGVTAACSGSGGAGPLCDVAPRSPGPGTNQCIDLAEGISPKSAVVSADADGPVSGFNSIVAVQIPSEIPSSTSSAGCGPGYRDAEVVTYDRDFASDGSSGNQGFYVSFN